MTKRNLRLVGQESSPSQGWHLSLLNKSHLESNPEYELAYQTWKDCWFEVFHAIEKPHLAHSNAFTECDMVTALFYAEKCAALLVHKLVNFNKEVWRDDSYFKPWPREALAKLTEEGPRVLICSHYTVNKDFRKGGEFSFPFAVKDLIAGVSFKYFLSTDAHSMTGNMRNAKGVQRSFYKWGATPLMVDVPCNGETSDLVGVFRGKVDLKADPELSPIVEAVWEDCLARNRRVLKKAA